MTASNWIVRSGETDSEVIERNRAAHSEETNTPSTKTVNYAQGGQVYHVQVPKGQSEVEAVLAARRDRTQQNKQTQQITRAEQPAPSPDSVIFKAEEDKPYTQLTPEQLNQYGLGSKKAAEQENRPAIYKPTYEYMGGGEIRALTTEEKLQQADSNRGAWQNIKQGYKYGSGGVAGVGGAIRGFTSGLFAEKPEYKEVQSESIQIPLSFGYAKGTVAAGKNALKSVAPEFLKSTKSTVIYTALGTTATTAIQAGTTYSGEAVTQARITDEQKQILNKIDENKAINARELAGGQYLKENKGVRGWAQGWLNQNVAFAENVPIASKDLREQANKYAQDATLFELQQQGLSAQEAKKAQEALDIRHQTMKPFNLAGQVSNEVASELTGRRIVGSTYNRRNFKDIIGQKKLWGERVKSTAPGIFGGAIVETTGSVQQDIMSNKSEYDTGDYIAAYGSGILFSQVANVGIQAPRKSPVSQAGKRGFVSYGTESVVDVVDVLEKPGDIGANLFDFGAKPKHMPIVIRGGSTNQPVFSLGTQAQLTKLQQDMNTGTQTPASTRAINPKIPNIFTSGIPQQNTPPELDISFNEPIGDTQPQPQKAGNNQIDISNKEFMQNFNIAINNPQSNMIPVKTSYFKPDLPVPIPMTLPMFQGLAGGKQPKRYMDELGFGLAVLEKNTGITRETKSLQKFAVKMKKGKK